MFTFGRDLRYLLVDTRSLNPRGVGRVNRFHVDDVVFPFDPNSREHMASAARCARLTLRILNHIRLHVPTAQVAAMNSVVDRVEKAAAGRGDGTELNIALNEAVQIAFAKLPHSRGRADLITTLVARAIYAATLACLTGSRGCLEDAFLYALEAVSSTEAEDLGTSIREELYLIRNQAARSSDGHAPARVPPATAPG
jgi:hypothetical protein